MGNHEFYRRLDELCSDLTQVGMAAEANRISYRLHKVAWTSAGELFRELYLELRKISDAPYAQQLPAPLKEGLAASMSWLANADPLHWTPEAGPPRNELSS